MRALMAHKALQALLAIKALKAVRAHKVQLDLSGLPLLAQEAHKAIPDLIALQGPKG